MASTGTLSIGLAGRAAETSTHKPSGRAPIAVASVKGLGVFTTRNNRTGRLALTFSGASSGVLTPRRPSGRLQVVVAGRTTASYNRRPKGRLSIAVVGRNVTQPTARRPSSRLSIIASGKGTTSASTRTGVTCRTGFFITTRALRTRVHSKLAAFQTRPPLQTPHLYSIETEKLRHNDALTWYGEMTAWILLWSERDFEQGYVDRCSVCYVPLGDIADTYKQVPSQKWCSNCYGTTFEGGVRAIVYRPGLWDQVRASEQVERRGLTVVQRSRVSIPADIEMRDNDFGVRADGSRWKLEQPANQGVATGFISTTDWAVSVGTQCEAQLLDPTSVAYTIPVDLDFINAKIGWMPYLPFPAIPPDVLNGPLVLTGRP